MYKIFLDKTKVFECDINIEGASLNESEVRLLLEVDDFMLAFKGKIDSAGNVKIPIQKLKGILKENQTGSISLEVIAEDTVFRPWKSEYQTDFSKKVEVKVNESIMEQENVKPKITFTLKEDPKPVLNVAKDVNKILEILKQNKTNLKSLYDNPIVCDKLVETFCKKNLIDDLDQIREIKKELLNRIKV